MAKPTFYTKPTCTTCKNARSFLDTHHLDVEQIDINKTPPPRSFLEKHVDAGRFLEFVSTRSPVFKTRALPRTKAEAIDLMVENPNLIKRPVLIHGSTVTFGFDKAAYARLK